MSIPHPPAGSPSPRPIQSYQDLVVWQVSVELTIECYRRTAAFPAFERFGLTAQMRRAAVSIVSNIAEGHGRRTRRAFAHHLSIARGSLKELEAQLVIAERLGYADGDGTEELRTLCQRVSRLIVRLQQALAPRAPPLN